MTERQAVELTRRLKVLHLRMAQEGPTERTGEALKSLADICEPVKKFVAMWNEVATPFWRRNAAVAAMSEVIDLLR